MRKEKCFIGNLKTATVKLRTFKFLYYSTIKEDITVRFTRNILLLSDLTEVVKITLKLEVSKYFVKRTIESKEYPVIRP